jgi:hypothetical protein
MKGGRIGAARLDKAWKFVPVALALTVVYGGGMNVKQVQTAKTRQRRSGSAGRPPARGRRARWTSQSDSGRDGRSWRERVALAQVLDAFLPQDHSAAKRLYGHLSRGSLSGAVDMAQHLTAFADAVLLDDIPEAIGLYTRQLDNRIGELRH